MEPNENDLRVAGEMLTDAAGSMRWVEGVLLAEFRLEDTITLVASAIATEREKERERFRSTIIEHKNLYGIGVGTVADSLRAAYDHLLLAIKDKQ